MVKDIKEVVIGREAQVQNHEYLALLKATTLAERRPVNNPERIATALSHANLIVTARLDGRLVGAARSVTDFSLCCYIADLIVHETVQGRGIGQRLIQETCTHVHPETKVFLISAPGAITFYEHLGLERLPHVFNIPMPS